MEAERSDFEDEPQEGSGSDGAASSDDEVLMETYGWNAPRVARYFTRRSLDAVRGARGARRPPSEPAAQVAPPAPPAPRAPLSLLALAARALAPEARREVDQLSAALAAGHVDALEAAHLAAACLPSAGETGDFWRPAGGSAGRGPRAGADEPAAPPPGVYGLECALCLTRLASGAANSVVLACGHPFHWATSSVCLGLFAWIRGKQAPTCPTCRAAIGDAP